jgi:hypothetical protein
MTLPASNSTTLDPAFLRAVVLLCAFKPSQMVRAQSALLLIGLQQREFTAAELPEEIVQGNKHISGAACGALVSLGLLEVVRRQKSPDPLANGRKLDVFRIPPQHVGRAKAWLKANGVDYNRALSKCADSPQQIELMLTR